MAVKIKRPHVSLIFLPQLSYLKEAETLIGLQVRSVMCLPIRNSEDDIIGVCQVTNKASGSRFTEHDEKVSPIMLSYLLILDGGLCQKTPG